MKKIIIFGANGQDGHYLEDFYCRQGATVVGVSRTGTCVQGDVGSPAVVEEIVRSHKPDGIFHLAARSTTHHNALFENQKTIGEGTVNILEAVHRLRPACKVFITGSGLQFLNTGEAIHEKDPFDASSAYAVARIQSVYAARYFRSLGIRIYVGYLFHHESPLRKATHVSQKIVQAVSRIANGSNEKLELGDISVEKEWAYAGDIVGGIADLMGQDDVFEAVIGTGKTYTIQDWLETCFGLIREDWKKHVMFQEGFAAEYKRLFSKPTTMQSLGWQPKTGFKELAQIMIRAMNDGGAIS